MLDRLQRADALFLEAVECHKRGDLPRAIALYGEAVVMDPELAGAFGNRGLAFSSMGRLAEALSDFDRAIALEPGHADYRVNKGIALKDAKDFTGARSSFEEALVLEPNHINGLNGLAIVLAELGEPTAAFESYQKALRVDPNHANTHNNLGTLFRGQNQFQKALAHYENAIRLNPQHADAFSNAANVLMEQGRSEESIQYFRKSLELRSNHFVFSNLLMALQYPVSIEPREIAAAHRLWGETHAPGSLAKRTHANDRSRTRRLRVGYLSPDFRSHPVAFFFEPILSAHNTEQVETFAYAHLAKTDAVTERLRTKFNHFRDITRLSDDAVATLIQQDQIDILVDLAGHTGNHRLLVLARKPAPILVTYLGYPNSTGLAAVDYRLTDRWADPEAHDEHCVEELVRLPSGFLCYEPPTDAKDLAPLKCDHAGFVTFGSFNVAKKVNPEVVTTWAKILASVPNSTIFLKAYSLGDPESQANYWARFEQAGISRDRVRLEGPIAAFSSHLSAYQDVDIALDPFPYNGTTTTCEALFMGVPVVTLAGASHAARVGVSILSRIGHPEWIASSVADYIARAIGLAGDVQRLRTQRGALRRELLESSLCDARAFTESLERVYRAMWVRYCTGDERRVDDLLGPMAAEPSPDTLLARLRRQAGDLS